MDWTGIAGAGVQLATGIGNLIQGKKNRESAEREARKNREFQTSERKDSQKWQEEQTKNNLRYQVQKEAYDFDKYYSPMARMAALKAAGLNPDLAYGSAIGSGMSGSAVVTPSAASASPGSVADLTTGEQQSIAGSNQIAGAVQTGINAAKGVADIKSQNTVTLLNGAKVRLTEAQTGFTKEDTKRITQQYRNLVIEAGKLNAETANIIQDTTFLKASTAEKNQLVSDMQRTIDLKIDALRSQYQHDLSEIGLNNEALEFLKQSFQDRLDSLRFANSKAEIDALNAKQQWRFSQQWTKVGDKEWKTNARILYDTVISAITSNAGLLETQLDIQKNYGQAHSIVQIASEIVRAIAAGLAAGALGKKLKGDKTPVTPLPSTLFGF
ncbi:DNA pilot protein [Sigmofec virus UA08Rod_4138]|uniref:DNA pilot protein n=1 Tax=Sigmofec virus UA08Rod_4138 TaxID=2929396 RepID=A0A976N2J8_9VIRU|nr:DNA pilot protein [Sigmofec virus UA08Rod_4138]